MTPTRHDVLIAAVAAMVLLPPTALVSFTSIPTAGAWVVVALAVTSGTFIAGILGAVVSVPLVAVAWAVFSKLRRKDPPMEKEIPTAKEIALSGKERSSNGGSTGKDKEATADA